MSDEVKNCFMLKFSDSLSLVHFIKLKLAKDDEILAENFYWRATDYQNYMPLQTMEKVMPIVKVQNNIIEIKNPTPHIALMIHLKLLDKNDKRILPVFWSDNYFSILPYETKNITFKN